ncbi:MAG: hypothetical protein B7C24_14200 [Bacteroidetes bacterium 4572_77]|nr:MAG: hypothetical protein B7C24_14200 [Bacteroidetes bacterium 4572_77]
MDKLTIKLTNHENSQSQYDWVDLELNNSRVGKVRCFIDGNECTIYSIVIYPEFQGKGYGKKFVELTKNKYKKVIADRVRFNAIGFWEKMDFIYDKNTENWVYHNSKYNLH